MSQPLAIDLFCGLFGWGAGFAAEGYHVIGFDIARVGAVPPGCELVLQDACTLEGSQLTDADVLVASSPCQEFSYRAMPWKKARGLPPPILGIKLFWQAFRLQLEIFHACGRKVPVIAENVRGAEKWVGNAGAHFGSFYLWGDVPALMPTGTHRKASVSYARHGTWFGESHGRKVDWRGQNPRDFGHVHGLEDGIKMRSPGHYRKPGSGPDWFDNGPARFGSRTDARKAVSAEMARIPFPLAQHIARCFKP